MRMIRSSGTRSPAAMIRATSLPVSVPRATSERRMSPVERWSRWKSTSIRAAWVPFPLPGGPKMMPIIPLHWRGRGGRARPGRDFVSSASQSWRGVTFQKIRSREDEQPRRRSRPGDEKEQSGSFSYVLFSGLGTAVCDLECVAAPPPVVRVLVEESQHRGIGTGGLAHLAQLEPSVGDLHIEVRFRPTWELLEHPVLADRLRHRLVDVVVPARRGLRQRDRATQLEAKKVAVSEDVLQDLVVAAETAALQPRFGASAMQLRRLEKGRIFGRPQQRGGVALGSQWRAGLDLDHASVDRGAAQAPRN